MSADCQATDRWSADWQEPDRWILIYQDSERWHYLEFGIWHLES